MEDKMERIVRERKAERQAIEKAEKHRLYAAFLESGLTIEEAERLLRDNRKNENRNEK